MPVRNGSGPPQGGGQGSGGRGGGGRGGGSGFGPGGSCVCPGCGAKMLREGSQHYRLWRAKQRRETGRGSKRPGEERDQTP